MDLRRDIIIYAESTAERGYKIMSKAIACADGHEELEILKTLLEEHVYRKFVGKIDDEDLQKAIGNSNIQIHSISKALDQEELFLKTLLGPANNLNSAVLNLWNATADYMGDTKRIQKRENDYFFAAIAGIIFLIWITLEIQIIQ